MITLDSINSANASIEIATAAGQALAIDGSGFITTNINGTIAVSATDLDIRDLAFATDSVDVSGSSVTVTATDLDIRDLAFASDSVTAHQGGSWSFSIGNISTWKTTAETATSTASELVSTPLASRAKTIIQNLGSKDIYIGPSNAVTTSNGVLVPKGSSMDYSFDDSADIWAITASGSSDIRVLEAA